MGFPATSRTAKVAGCLSASRPSDCTGYDNPPDRPTIFPDHEGSAGHADREVAHLLGVEPYERELTVQGQDHHDTWAGGRNRDIALVHLGVPMVQRSTQRLTGDGPIRVICPCAGQ